MSNKKRKNASRKYSGLTWFLLTVVVILVALLAWMITNIDSGELDMPVNIPFSNGLVITDIGSYTGAFVEDGSNEDVSGVLKIMVENTGDEYIQYAEINLSGHSSEAHFALSTLGPGEVVVLLEQDRMTYTEGFTSASARNVTLFSEEPDTLEDKLEIQLLDGGLNITNISGEDIDSEIIVHFKSFYKDVYYGGITYRGRITGGLKAGETRQLMSANISFDGTKVVFVSISE